MEASSGGCTCGQIQYSIGGPALQLVACHCGMCRRMTGAPFSSYLVVKEAQFDVTAADDSLASYAVTERATRHFCRRCGTPVFNTNPHTYTGLVMLYLGTVQGHETLVPGVAIFCEDKLPWVSLPEAAKPFAAAPRR
ncbi:GFA family protein [Massilia sp. Leaf139]|uniref:GFA family protein n=1 Tax=Massilia sp. Leaf139 TaxID=1736272 RepID=UPI0006F42789|nr:GFA family protein [Massilia sp. Leaf139]KQQ86600.1 hypothetical protein ASF77_20075 [Massilia sp. Leaf139]